MVLSRPGGAARTVERGAPARVLHVQVLAERDEGLQDAVALQRERC